MARRLRNTVLHADSGIGAGPAPGGRPGRGDGAGLPAEPGGRRGHAARAALRVHAGDHAPYVAHATVRAIGCATCRQRPPSTSCWPSRTSRPGLSA